MKFSRPPQSAYSDTFTFVTPAKAGVQYGGRLDSGLRRNDELNIVANQEQISEPPSDLISASMSANTMDADVGRATLPHYAACNRNSTFTASYGKTMWPSSVLLSTPALSSAVTSPCTAFTSRSARRAASRMDTYRVISTIDGDDTHEQWELDLLTKRVKDAASSLFVVLRSQKVGAGGTALERPNEVTGAARLYRAAP